METTTNNETPREFAERKRQEKKSKIDVYGKDASVVVTKTKDTKGFIGAIQKLDDAVAQVRNNLGRPGGANWDQLVAIMKYTNEKENEIRAFANRLLKGKFDIPTAEEAAADMKASEAVTEEKQEEKASAKKPAKEDKKSA